MKVVFYTLGCKVNQYETEALREIFVKNEYTAVNEGEAFDIAVINSCSVTAESDRKTRQLLHKVRRQNPDGIIVLTGCMAQTLKTDGEELLDADIIVGNTDIKKVFELVEKYKADKKRIISLLAHEKDEKFNTPSINSFAERTRAYMKIEDGCDRFCTYCIIPYARGFVRSKPIDEIKKEAQTLAQKGFTEVVLVGINLSSYGKGEDKDLCDAVDAVCEVDGIKRVRLGSLEPDYISDEMLKRLKNQEKFCPQFHLSLQSGCDETLKRMNRHYDSKFYYDLVKRIRKIFDNPSITTDIMVGFAGESEQEFLESVDFLKKVGFAKAHVFAYSRRKGTFADKMPNQITRAEKTRRAKIMAAASKESEQNFLESQIGKCEEVLFETIDNGLLCGYTKNYSRVAIEADFTLVGKIKKVEIISANDGICFAKL